jgi:hypothetical protein
MAIVKEVNIQGKRYFVPEIHKSRFENIEYFENITRSYLCVSARCSLTPCHQCILSEENEEAFNFLMERNFPEEVIRDRMAPPVDCQVKIGKRTFVAKEIKDEIENCSGCDLFCVETEECRKLTCTRKFRPDNLPVIFVEVK